MMYKKTELCYIKRNEIIVRYLVLVNEVMNMNKCYLIDYVAIIISFIHLCHLFICAILLSFMIMLWKLCDHGVHGISI